MIFFSVFRHSLSFGKRVIYEILYDDILKTLCTYVYVYIVHMFQVLILSASILRLAHSIIYRLSVPMNSIREMYTLEVNYFKFK